MIKNENLSKIPKPYYYSTENNTIDSNKENKNINFKKINFEDNDDKFKKNHEIISLNNNEENYNSKTNMINNSSYNNKFKTILNNNIKNNLNMKDIIHLKNKINSNYLNNPNVKINFEKINHLKLIKKNIPLRQYFKYNKPSKNKIINTEPSILSKQIYTPRCTKNSCYNTETNINYTLITSSNNKIITPINNKLSNQKENQIYLTRKNNSQINEKINNFIINSGVFNGKQKEQNIKCFSLDNEIEKGEMPKENISKNATENNLSSDKYSKGCKLETNNKNIIADIMELIKVKKNESDILTQKEREAKEEIKKNIENYNPNEDKLREIKEENKNEQNGKIKIIKMSQIPYNQKIFNKIMDEVKGEKNYIQKIVHKQIINHRNSLNSLSNTKKKYDTNTYKEITTKRIKYPFNTLSNIDNGNNCSINTNHLNLNTEAKDSDRTNLNISYISISNNINKNLKEDLNTNNKDIDKKSSIKIKKIPLNKLKRKIQINNINNINNNFNHNLTTNTNRNSIDCSERINTNFYPINQIKNSYSTKCFQNSQITNSKLLNKIPLMNSHKTYNSINNINNELFKKVNNGETKSNMLYNKVKINKIIPGMKNRKYVQINRNNTFTNNTYEKNSNNSQNKSMTKNFSGIYYYQRNFKNILSEKCLTITKDENKLDNEISNNEKKNRQKEDKKKEYSNKINSLENQNQSLYINNVYSKKKNNTIFKCYMTNRNKILNKSNKYINSTNFNGNTESISLLNLDSNIHENLSIRKHFSGFINLKKGISGENSSINNEKPNNEIKLEQIISLLSFEDLLILEDKLNIVFNLLKNGKKIYEELFDLWNYFFSSTLKPKFDQIYKYFLKETESMKTFINYSLILIIIYYDFSFNSSKNSNNICFLLYESLRLIYINLLIVISSIKNKIKLDNKDHYNLRLIEMSNINKIIEENLINFNNNSYNEENISFNRELLNNNANLLIKNTSLIIKNYKQSNISYLFNTINNNSLDDINSFFRKKILHEDFLGCSVLASTYLKEKNNFIPGKMPYILEKNNKKYSLVLDLDETLINFKVNHEQNDEGVLKLRPGVLTFLETVREYYEIILFTEASEGYTKLIMEAFNKKEFFDYKLYRQHTIIIGEDFVKDLQRIGRPLDRIIIIDNIAQNFRMQKSNGINIKPFHGEEQNDKALIDLIPILINIAKDNIDTRNGLVKYRDEIITKISSNLYRRYNEK